MSPGIVSTWLLRRARRRQSERDATMVLIKFCFEILESGVQNHEIALRVDLGWLPL